MAKTTKPDNAKSQHKRFLETARQLECDEDRGAIRGKAREDREGKACLKTEKGSIHDNPAGHLPIMHQQFQPNDIVIECQKWGQAVWKRARD